MANFLQTIVTPGVGGLEDWAPFVLRVGLGLALLTHGYPKVFKNFGQFSGYVASLKWPAPKLFAVLAAVIELLGALLLIVGLFTKAVSAVLVIYFVLVLLSAHRGHKFKDWELAFLYLIGMLVLWTINDAGVWALSSFWGR